MRSAVSGAELAALRASGGVDSTKVSIGPVTVLDGVSMAEAREQRFLRRSDNDEARKLNLSDLRKNL